MNKTKGVATPQQTAHVQPMAQHFFCVVDANNFHFAPTREEAQSIVMVDGIVTTEHYLHILNVIDDITEKERETLVKCFRPTMSGELLKRHPLTEKEEAVFKCVFVRYEMEHHRKNLLWLRKAS